MTANEPPVPSTGTSPGASLPTGDVGTGARDRGDLVIDLLNRVFVVGPDPPRAGDPPTSLGFLLPWWLRLLFVLAAYLIGRCWADSGVGQQLSWGLDYGALIGVSLWASYWKTILLINLASALLWFLPLGDPVKHRRLWRFGHVVTWVNRQFGHLEAYGTWMTVCIVAWPRLDAQLPALMALMLLAQPIVNGLTRLYFGARATKEDGSLNWLRRPLIYGATLLGLLFLAAQAPRQISKLGGVMAALVLGGLLPRFLRHLKRQRKVRGPHPSLALRAEFRKAQMGWPRKLDLVLNLALVALMLVSVGAAFWLRQKYDQSLTDLLQPSSDQRLSSCVPDLGGPSKAEVSLFLVSDTQLHELEGKRFPGQAEMAEAIVPVALRPVELDMLSPATLWRFGSVYRVLAEQEARAGRTMLWAHLGDFGDLSCRGELARMADLIGHFGMGRLAGIAPGNHDKSFTGNFFWSPFWDRACNTGRLEKASSDRLIQSWTAFDKEHPDRQVLAAGARMTPVKGSWWQQASAVTGRGTALVTVSPLGEVTGPTRDGGGAAGKRGLIGVFVDTADELDFDFGISGVRGTFSRAQADTIVAQIEEVQKAMGGAYNDPAYVLFGHHPFDELAPAGHDRLAELITRLDGDAHPGHPANRAPRGDDSAGDGGSDEASLRVLAFVSAHTHIASSQYHCIDHRRFLRELIIGSTIDPPQEAALLTVGPDAQGRLALRVHTIPAVARPGRTCGTEPAIAAVDCQRVVARLQKAPDCRELFEPDGVAPGPDCQTLERSVSPADRLRAIVTSLGPTEPDAIKSQQKTRANRLFNCLCHDGRCPSLRPEVKDLSNDRATTDFLLALAGDGAVSPDGETWEQDLTCLSWAAAGVQAHKAAGMNLADSLRCAFDDPSLQAAQDHVAVLKMDQCR